MDDPAEAVNEMMGIVQKAYTTYGMEVAVGVTICTLVAVAEVYAKHKGQDIANGVMFDSDACACTVTVQPKQRGEERVH